MIIVTSNVRGFLLMRMIKNPNRDADNVTKATTATIQKPSSPLTTCALVSELEETYVVVCLNLAARMNSGIIKI